MNSVKSLKERPWLQRTHDERMEIKRLGPDQPDLTEIHNRLKLKGRTFQKGWYTRCPWLTGCIDTLRVYCFPCMLFEQHGMQRKWASDGYNDWGHIFEKVQRHGKSEDHINNVISLGLYGNVNIFLQNKALRKNISEHNLEVNKNRHVLFQIIESIKFCSAFELALRGYEETDGSSSRGLCSALVNFSAELDGILAKQLKNFTFSDGTSTIKNELLDIMYTVCIEHIKHEISEADYLSVMADDTTEISNDSQNVVVFRYLVGNDVVERFWSFCSLPADDALSISDEIIKCLCEVLPQENRTKLIAQCYDGSVVMKGYKGGKNKALKVQNIVKDQFKNAEFIHCYAHQLNLVLQQALASVTELRFFFANVTAFSVFFSRSQKRMEFLNRIVSKENHQNRWNFEGHILSTLNGHRADLVKCFKAMIDHWQGDLMTVTEAASLLRWLEDYQFLVFLQFFDTVFIHVDILMSVFNKSGTGTQSSDIQQAVDSFVQALKGEASDIPKFMENFQCENRCETRGSDDVIARISQVLYEGIDILIEQITDRLDFQDHVIAASLLNSQYFELYNALMKESFLQDTLIKTVESYPDLNLCKLKAELKIIYKRLEFRNCCGPMSLLQVLIVDNLLSSTFSETVKLMKILVTIPMISAEPERCFSTLKKIKTFLRNSMLETRLNALAMLSIEKKMITTIDNFNNTVMEKFARIPNRIPNFLYK